MEKLNRTIRIWVEEIRALEHAIIGREADLELRRGSLGLDQLLEEIRHLSFQRAVRIGQVRTAQHSRDALDKSVFIESGGQSEALVPRPPRGYRDRSQLVIEEFYELHRRLNGDEEVSLESLFEDCCDLRRLMAVAVAMPMEGAPTVKALGQKIVSKSRELPKGDLMDLRDSLRYLLSEFWIYRSIGSAVAEKINAMYEPLFEIAQLTEMGETNMDISGLDGALERANLEDREILRSVERVLRAAADIAIEDGTSVFDAMEGRYFSEGDPNIVVIPGDGNSGCRPVVLAIASGRGRGDRSPKNVIKRMQEVLISCAPTVQVAIFLSDAAGMGSVLEENLSYVEAHIRRGSLKAFLPVVVVGRKLTVLDWRS